MVVQVRVPSRPFRYAEEKPMMSMESGDMGMHHKTMMQKETM
jgi:hypothetical protein